MLDTEFFLYYRIHTRAYFCILYLLIDFCHALMPCSDQKERIFFIMATVRQERPEVTHPARASEGPRASSTTRYGLSGPSYPIPRIHGIPPPPSETRGECEARLLQPCLLLNSGAAGVGWDGARKGSFGGRIPFIKTHEKVLVGKTALPADPLPGSPPVG
jgi:hypothetical protein